MLKIKDAVRVIHSRRVGDVQALHAPNAIHPDGLALVRFMGSQVKRWFKVSDLKPLDWLND